MYKYISFIFCMMFAIMCIHAVGTNKKSSYQKFANSYESLFKEAPAGIWAKNNRPTCCGNGGGCTGSGCHGQGGKISLKPSCSGCAAM